MISFITWTNNAEEYDRLQASVPFKAEWVAIDQVAKSMAEAYSIGQQQATGDVLCYIHQDVIIHDPFFEQKVTSFCDSHRDTAGFIGVIGNLKPAERCWWEMPRKFLRGRVVQTDKTGKNKATVIDFGRYTGIASQLDGLMLITTHRDWRWPRLPGIHFLDLWMCREAKRKGRVNYILDVEVEHTSWGETSSKGFLENYELYKQG